MIASAPKEVSGYLPCKGQQLYYILLNCPEPKAVVLLCGPFPTERLYSLAAWMRWGRYLQGQGFAVARFDYRGASESTGCFSDFGFSDWLEDIERVASWLEGQFTDTSLVLHGMAMGGLLAQRAFVDGLGRALLMWSAPASGQDILRKGLLTRISADMLMLKPAERKTIPQYMEHLAGGRPLQVDGYPWGRALWRSADKFSMDPEYCNTGEGREPGRGRPWKHIVLGPEMAPLVRSVTLSRALNPRSALVPRFPLNPDFTAFHAANAEWILRAARPDKGGPRA